MPYKPKAAFAIISGAVANASLYTESCTYWSKLFDGKNYTPTNASTEEVSIEGSLRTVSSSLAFQDVDSLVASVVNPTPAVTLRAKKQALADGAKAQQATVNTLLTDMNAGKLQRRAAELTCAFKRSFMKVLWDDAIKMPFFRVVDPRHIMFDLTADTYQEVKWLIETTTISKADFDELTKTPKGGEGKRANEKAKYPAKFKSIVYPKAVPSHINKTNVGSDEVNRAFSKATNLIVIYEFYDLTGKGRVYHFADGVEEPLFTGPLPFKYMRNPFHMLTFHNALNDIGGISDIDLIGQFQEEIDELFIARLEYVKAGIPIAIFNDAAMQNGGQVRSQFASASGPNDAITIQMNEGVPLRDAFSYSETPRLSPDFNGTIHALNELRQQTLGLPGYSRGGNAGADFALELQLSDQDRKTRQGWRISAVNEMTIWMGQAIIATLAELLPEGSPLWVRSVEDDAPEEVSHQVMGLAQMKSVMGEEPWDIDFTASVQSTFEANPAAQVQQINASFPIIAQMAQMGLVNMDVITRKYLTALNLSEAFVEEADREQQQGEMAQQQGGAPGEGGVNPLASAGAMATQGPEGDVPTLPGGPQANPNPTVG